MLAKDIERHVQDIQAHTSRAPPVYISQRKCGQMLGAKGMHLPPKQLRLFATEINAALLEYGLRLEVERTPLSSWLPKFRRIVVLLRKLRSLLPDKREDLFNIISHFGESYAASHGPHSGLSPYELENPLHNFPFTLNYRSDERLEETIKGINEVAGWMQAFLDARVAEINRSNKQEMSAPVWLIGYELPRIYEAFFKAPFGVTVTTKKYGPGVRFVLGVVEAVGIVTAAGTKFSALTIRTYRRRARKYGQR